MARVRIKSKRTQFLALLLFLALLVPGTLDQVKDMYLAFRLSGSGQTIEGRVANTSTRGRMSAKRYYVEYAFDLDGVTYSTRHSTPEAVMLRARETRTVQIYYLASNPSANAPLFWGESALGYALGRSWGLLLLTGLCLVLASQVWKMLREDQDELQFYRYTLPEAMLGLIVVLYAGLGIYGLFGWSSFRLSDIAALGGSFGEMLIPFLAVGFLLLVFGWLALQEVD